MRDDQVLLAMKKRGFGSGKWNGYGGKVEEGESPAAAAVRELEEESGLIATLQDLQQVALIRFYFDTHFFSECSVYLIHAWQQEPVETEEMKPTWYPLSQLPVEEMWAADREWVPRILSGETIEADIFFNADGSVVHAVNYKPVTFT